MPSANPASYREVLSNIRANLGPAPRTFSFWDRLTYLRMARPSWCRGKEPLGTMLDHRVDLLRDGVVVWAYLVQANQMMFKAGSTDCPGEVVYCTSPNIPIDPAQLEELAAKIFALKGTTPRDPSMTKIADHLTNERTRVFGLAVPNALCPTFPAAISTLLFNRKHLPTGKLTGSLFPLLVMPQQPRYAMVVPGRYWPAALADFWVR